MKLIKYKLMETAARMPVVILSSAKPEKDMSRLYDIMAKRKPMI